MKNENEERASAFSATIDDLKQALFDAEDALNDLRDKVAVEVVLCHGADEGLETDGTPVDMRWGDMMTFEKVGKGWGLCYYRSWEDADPTDRVRKSPIGDAPLRIRKLAAQKLPELLEAIRQRRNEELEELKQAAEAARAFAARVYAEESTRG